LALRVEWMEPELRSLRPLGDYCGPVLVLDCGGPLEARMNVIRLCESDSRDEPQSSKRITPR
jgi:hypothetical protein